MLSLCSILCYTKAIIYCITNRETCLYACKDYIISSLKNYSNNLRTAMCFGIHITNLIIWIWIIRKIIWIKSKYLYNIILFWLRMKQNIHSYSYLLLTITQNMPKAGQIFNSLYICCWNFQVSNKLGALLTAECGVIICFLLKLTSVKKGCVKS